MLTRYLHHATCRLALAALLAAGCTHTAPRSGSTGAVPPTPRIATPPEAPAVTPASPVPAILTNAVPADAVTNLPAVTPPAAPVIATNKPAEARPATNATTAVEGDDEAYEQIRLLTKTLMIIRASYVDESKTSYKDLVHSALGGMVQSLDPYSQFLEPVGYQSLKEETQGEFGGIGIVLGTKDGILSVIAPMEDTPAFRAGVLAGDKIIEINGERTDGLGVPDAVKRLRGAKGTPVKIKVLRSNRDVKEFSLVRDFIKITSVKGTRMLDGGIAYVRITQFSDPTAAALREALEKFSRQDLRALVLDLRNNPGGLLGSAIQVSELFLKKGTVIVSTRGRDGTAAPPPAVSTRTHPWAEIPMAVLVNAGSASASEIVAGALQDNKRAVLVGDTTFGKGSVQSVVPVEGGSALRLTTARYYTPSGRSIHEKGIEPDIAVPLTTDEWIDVLAKRNYDENPALPADKEKPTRYDTAADRQLDRAVDLLKGILIFEARQ